MLGFTVCKLTDAKKRKRVTLAVHACAAASVCIMRQAKAVGSSRRGRQDESDTDAPLICMPSQNVQL